MTTSIIETHRNILLQRLRDTAPGTQQRPNYKILICDNNSKKILDNVAKEDQVLDVVKEVVSVEMLAQRRGAETDMGAIYLLTPTPYILEWLEAELKREYYREAYVIWTSRPHPNLEASLRRSEPGRLRIATLSSLNVGFIPVESNLVTFGQPYSFQVLFNQHCDGLIRKHLDDLTQKIVAVCVALGEYPLVRYYRPRTANHEAAVLCTHLAKFVQDELDRVARDIQQDSGPSPRPRAVLLITDRTMDLMAPLVHELTYQAMATDLLTFQEDALLDGRGIYKDYVRPDQNEAESKDKESPPELNEKDKIWVENRHLHMKDLLVKLSNDFKKFQAKNPQFANNDGQNISVNTIKDMLAGLPEFQEGKRAFSLHIDIAERCAKHFQDQKLMDVTSLEQSLATGLDEDNQKPKNVTDQLVRLLADESVTLDARARLLMLYVIYRGGIQDGDIRKLQLHGELRNEIKEIIYNLHALGARVIRQLGDNSNQYEPLYPTRETTYAQGEEVSLSRFEPMLRYALEELCQGQLDSNKFPPTKPHLDQSQQPTAAQTLRSAGKPTWANTRPSTNKPRQRIIVFMAGGATYSEARVCYEVSQQMGREIFLTTSHMITPKSFMADTARLHKSKDELRLVVDPVPPKPDWMKNPMPPSARPQQQQQQAPAPRAGGLPSGPRPPTEAMQNMNLGSSRPQNLSSRPGTSQTVTPPHTAGSFSTEFSHSSGKLKKKEKDEKKDKKDKHKKFGLF